MSLSFLNRSSLESDSRDAYGFAVRPQHIHTYRPYINIYQKEERERLERWKIFLGQLTKHMEPCLSEEEDRDTSRPTDEETEETLHTKVGEANEEASIKVKEDDDDDDDKKEHEVTSSAKVTELNEEIYTEEPFSTHSTESEREREVQLAEETRTCQGKRWAKTRPAICAIENMMESRVKKGKKMKYMNESGDLPPSIKDETSPDQESDHEFEEKICVNEIRTTEESSTGNDASQEPPFPWKEELESLVLGGVPKDLRGQIWQAFVGVKARRVDRYFEHLMTQENYDDDRPNNSSGVFRRWKKQIEKDLPQTFPGHPALNDNGRDSLRRLLLAYARYNPSVGYCPGMNFFAGLLLLMMPEENAFWTLVGIIDDYFDGYYTVNMIESQVDQLVFEELMRERFPRLATHLDYLGVHVTWISAPWFLSIFVNMLPWESVLRIWDVILFEGNRVMLFRTALALMELYGPALLTTKDAGDAITLLQSLVGSMFDSSQLVLTACMGFLAVTDSKLHELREKYRSDVLVVVEERIKKGWVWKDSKGLASKLYTFRHDHDSQMEEKKPAEDSADGDASKFEHHRSNLDEFLSNLNVDSNIDSLPDLQDRVDWMKVELFRLLEEKRAAVLRAEELETALVELVKEDNRRELSARIEELEHEVGKLHQALADKKEQEVAVNKVLVQLEQEQVITEEGRKNAEEGAVAERTAVALLQEKYEKAMASIAEMEKRAALAESMLEATMLSESGKAKAQSSKETQLDSAKKKVGDLLSFGLRWRDSTKGKRKESSEGSPKPNSHRKGNYSLG